MTPRTRVVLPVPEGAEIMKISPFPLPCICSPVRETGMLEYWNIGILGSNANRNFFTHHPIIPPFHYSIFSLDILYLLPNLFKLAFDLDHALRNLCIIGFSTNGVDFPMDLLKQKIHFPAYRLFPF